MERNIVTLDRPIDPSEMDDDGAVVGRIGIVHATPDPTKVVTNPSADPRGPGFEEPPPTTGPAVVPVSGPLIPLAPKGAGVQQLRQAAPAAPPVDKETEDLQRFVRDLGMDPTEVGLPADTPPVDGSMVAAADAASEAPPAQASTPRASPQGDLIARAEQRALQILRVLPRGCELFVGGDTGPEAIELVMGLGLLIGKGVAVYRGDGHYRLKGTSK